MSRRRFIVSGATGFLGGAVVDRLLRDGCEVVALGRRADVLEKLGQAGARTIACDLAKDGAPINGLAADVFVHCAALSSPWGKLADFHAANVTGTERAIAIAHAAGVSRFVHISTPSVYFRFADQVGLFEDTPLPKPVNAYAATKRLAEQRVLERAKAMDPITLRPRGLYGAGDTALLPRLLRIARQRALPLMRGGNAATDLTHVNDVVDAVLAAASAKAPGERRIFNVSGGVALNVKSVIEAVASRAGVRVRWRSLPSAAVIAAARTMEIAARLRPGQPEPPVTAYSVALLAYTQTLDISAAAETLGWRPKISFEEGLDRTFGATP